MYPPPPGVERSCYRVINETFSCLRQNGWERRQKSATMPGATLQLLPAGVWRRTAPGRPRRPRRGCPCRTAVRRGPRSRGDVPSIGLAPTRLPAGWGGQCAGAACWAPASSGGVLASFLVRHVGLCVGPDRWCGGWAGNCPKQLRDAS